MNDQHKNVLITVYENIFNRPIYTYLITGETLANVTVTVTVHKKSSGDFLSFVSDALDYVPFVGSIKEIGEGIYNGDWKRITMWLLC